MLPSRLPFQRRQWRGDVASSHHNLLLILMMRPPPHPSLQPSAFSECSSQLLCAKPNIKPHTHSNVESRPLETPSESGILKSSRVIQLRNDPGSPRGFLHVCGTFVLPHVNTEWLLRGNTRASSESRRPDEGRACRY